MTLFLDIDIIVPVEFATGDFEKRGGGSEPGHSGLDRVLVLLREKLVEGSQTGQVEPIFDVQHLDLWCELGSFEKKRYTVIRHIRGRSWTEIDGKQNVAFLM